MTIRKTHEAVAKKLFSFVELTQDKLKIAKRNQFGEYITVCEQSALNAALLADQLFEKEGPQVFTQKPLLGIPLAIKDLIMLNGVRTTCGSKIMEDYTAPYTATVLTRLEGAGAHFIGKTNLDEFGMGSSNENSAFGPVSLPGHPDRVAGGSSGGSAAAVKSDSCIGALGTDTGGSIRLPASFCGIVGIKPTYGRVSRYGQVAYASSLDQIGPLARTVEDAALLLDILSGYDDADSTSCPMPPTQCQRAAQGKVDWTKIRLGVPKEYFVGGLQPEVERSVQKALKWAQAQGAQIVEVSLPHTRYAVSVYYLVAVSEASSNLARFDGVRFGSRPVHAEEVRNLPEFYENVRALFGAEVKRRIILGTFALSAGYSEAYYKRACQVRRKIKEDFEVAFEKVDLIVGPVATSTAFKLGEKIDDPLKMYLNDIFTIPVNLAGLPAMSIPCGEDSSGLSVGLHLVAPVFGEESMVSVAAAFEKGLSAGTQA
jgi:aspartyl-tRNA(Asn)/glutamyl-tRNA(Gln) amidotransferase subunit A